MKKVKILELRPTQFAVGMLEVDEKIRVVSEYSKKQIRRYIDDNPVPVVISPEGEMYVVDHHHFLCVCYHVGIKKIKVEIVADHLKSDWSYKTFWKWMLSNRSAYPFCQFGEGPRNALYLPKDIRGLADDPYRSLAWYVRKSGAFESSDKNFAEFRWANFFRNEGLLDETGVRGMQAALVQAVKLAQSKKARTLPGYGKLNLEDRLKAVKTAKAHGKSAEALS